MMRFSNVMSTRWRLPCRPPVSIDELPDHFGYLAFFFFFFSFGTSIGFIVYTGRPFFFFIIYPHTIVSAVSGTTAKEVQ